MLAATANPLVFLFLVNVFLILIGTFLETVGAGDALPGALPDRSEARHRSDPLLDGDRAQPGARAHHTAGRDLPDDRRADRAVPAREVTREVVPFFITALVVLALMTFIPPFRSGCRTC